MMKQICLIFLWFSIAVGGALDLDRRFDDLDWSRFTSRFPKLSVKRMNRFQQLQRLLNAPRPEIFRDWAHKWPRIHLDYGGKHPFENRELQSSSSSSSSIYQPIRIKFLTSPLESQLNQSADKDAAINHILTSILPEVSSIWSSHLSVIPNTSPTSIDNSVCFGLFDGMLPEDVLQNGVSDADLVIITSAVDVFTISPGTTQTFCDPSIGTLASAVLCTQDQFDRPAIGFINFCLNATYTYQGRRIRRRTQQQQQPDDGIHVGRQTQSVEKNNDVLVALHEIGHVLGQTSQLFPYFRNATTGDPLTPRPFTPQTVTCIYNVTRTVIFPANNTVQIGVTDKGITYYDIVTPRVRQVVRNHFNCQTLNGARLEARDTFSEDCTGSHWSGRLFFGELMEAKVLLGVSEILSPLTLALMEDTGWYQVNYGNTQLFPFGLNAGCDFVNGDCIVNDEVPEYGKGYFCNYTTAVDGDIGNGTDIFCDPTHNVFALCSLFDLQQLSPSFLQTFAPGGVPVRYFSNTNLIGIDAQAEYCPMTTFPVGVVCSDSSGQINTFYEGEMYGATNSRCIDVRFYSRKLGKNVNFPGCFQVKCDPNSSQVTVNGQVCSYDFEEITVYSVNQVPITMTCPRLSTLCPDRFCPSDCSGRGICNYSATGNLSTCQCFNSSDTSVSCNANKNSFTAPTTAPSAAATGGASSSTPSPTPSGPIIVITASPSGRSTTSPTPGSNNVTPTVVLGGRPTLSPVNTLPSSNIQFPSLTKPTPSKGPTPSVTTTSASPIRWSKGDLIAIMAVATTMLWLI